MAGAIHLSSYRFPKIGVGTAAWGGPFPPIPERQALDLIQATLSSPPAFFDSAPIYAGGLSEVWLGHGLEGVDRSNFILSTKAGYTAGEAPDHKYQIELSRDNLIRSVERSLKRMKVDFIDIVHLHDPDCCLEDALGKAFPLLASLRDQGLIKAVGAGMNQWQMLAEFARGADFDCFLLAGRYTLLEQESLELLDLCEQKGIYLFLGGVFNTGVLATGAVPGARYNYHSAPKEILDRVGRIEQVCARYQIPLRAAALQFPLAHAAVRSLVVGMQSVEEYQDVFASLNMPIPSDFWAELKSIGLIDQRAPVPKQPISNKESV
jgi:D-threo-aldose 1-dehydrogenase